MSLLARIYLALRSTCVVGFLYFFSILITGCKIDNELKGFLGSEPPTYVALLSSLPNSFSSVTILGVTVSGADVISYRYKLGSVGSTDCANSIGYSADIAVSTPISDDISSVADDSIKICVIGKNSSAKYQPMGSATSFIWVKDTTEPLIAGALNDGAYYTSLSSTPLFTWSTATDTGGSGINFYELALGSTPSGVDILNWTNIGNVTSYQQTGLAFANGVTYYASIRARDNALNLSAAALASDGWMADVGLPTAPTNFSDGSLNISLTQSPILTWTSATDGESGVNSYVIAIGTTAGGTDIMNWINVGNVTSYQATGLALSANTLYYASIKSLDNAGNNSAVAQGNGWRTLTTQKLTDNVLPQVRMSEMGANYGNSVAVSEDGLTLAVGSQYDDLDASGANYTKDAGAVFIYIYSGGTWQFQQKIVGIGTNSRLLNDYFGVSVTLGGASGDTLAVGAYGQDYDTTGLIYGADLIGAVYVFTRSGSTWSQQQKIVGIGTNSRIDGDRFGWSVVLGGTTSDTLAVGAYLQSYDAVGDNYAKNAGAVYVFTRSGSTWSQQQKIVGTGTNGRMGFDYFGWSIALGGTAGDTLAVGAYGQSYDASGGGYVSRTGAVSIFTRSGVTWSLEQKVIATGTNGRIADDDFGASVDLGGSSADTLAIGANNQDYDASGSSYAQNAGAVYVFTRSGSTWSQQQKIVATGANGRIDTDSFGRLVSLGGSTGDTLAVGAFFQDYDESGGNYIQNTGAGYIFTRSGVTWSQQQKIAATGTNGRSINDNFGVSAALGGASGDVLVVGAIQQDYDSSGANYVTDAGAVFVSTRTGSTWTQQQKIVDLTPPQVRMASETANYGRGVAVSDDGLTLAVGVRYDNLDENGANYMNDSGAAFIYTYSGGTWLFQQKIVATGTNGRMAGDYFGNVVALGGATGDTLAVGALQQDYNASGDSYAGQAGAVYIFVRSGATWSQQQKIVGTGTNGRLANDYFGDTVALGGVSGDTLAVGTSEQDYNTSGDSYAGQAGAVYIFVRSGVTWSQQQKIVGTGTNGRLPGDNFGELVALGGAAGDTLAVGADSQDYDSTGANFSSAAGAVYIFTRSGVNWTLEQKIVASGTNGRLGGDNFGYSLALGSSTGNTLAVTAYGQDYDELGDNYAATAGAAYIFTRVGVTWSLQQKIVGTGSNSRLAGDRFGYQVGLGGSTGDQLIVGADSQDYDSSGEVYVVDAGAAYIFTRVGVTWSLQQKIVGSGVNGRLPYDWFGYSVALAASSGDTIAVGAYLQDYDAVGLNYVPDAGAVFVYH